ncbi:MAG: methyltransferase regulatory domain-containing protein [Alphaproteobacteria bacterium]|nr:methyltransferase regulatory domain-containing protein [Alphaproteobacteria bacterium]
MPEVPRPPRPPLAAAHPAQLAAQATLAGRAAPALDGAQVLHLAATPEELLPLAWSLPSTTFHAVALDDGAGDALATGREALGLTNLTLDGPLPARADLVVWHRGFSERTDPADALAHLARRLPEDGLLLLGWCVLPGWHMLGMVRELLRFHVGRTPDAPPAAAARALLDLLADAMPPSGAGSWLRAVRATVRTLDDGELATTFLAPQHHPLHAHALHAHAAEAGLVLLGDAERREGSAARLPDHVVDFLVDERRAHGPVVAEQHVDLLVNRAFRLTVLGRAGRPEAARPLVGLWVGTPDPAHLVGTHPALDALRAAWPRFLPYEALPEGGSPEARLQAVLEALEADAVLVRTRPPAVGGDRVPAVVRHLAAAGLPVPDLLHVARPLSPEDRVLLARGEVPPEARARLAPWLAPTEARP